MTEQTNAIESPVFLMAAAHLMAEVLENFLAVKKVDPLNSVPRRVLEAVVPLFDTAAKHPENEMDRNICAIIRYAVPLVPKAMVPREMDEKIEKIAEFLKAINEPRTFKEDELRLIEELRDLFGNLEGMGKGIISSGRGIDWWETASNRHHFFAELAMASRSA